jgi:CSLREA domain-containing protein
MSLDWPARRRHARPGSPHPWRPRLERLEDRTAPATFTVTTTLDVVDPADGKLSLREAITKANALAGADTIVLPAGVFKIALDGEREQGNATGDFDVTDSLTVRGAGAGLTVVDAQQKDRAFDVIGSASGSIRVVLQGLTARNGLVDGGGGAVRVADADLVVRDCVLAGNRASSSGGGIQSITKPGTGNVTLIRTTVARNATGEDGGGLAVGGAAVLTVTGGTVRRNVAGTFAGGISAVTVNLTGSAVSGNTARTGSGGIDATTTMTLTDCTVSGNTGGGGGGGFFAQTATVTRCTVSGNVATFGGGIDAGTVTLTNSTVSGNTAASDSGGINANDVTLTNCTVSGNAAVSGSGGGINAPRVTLTNCTVSGNVAGTTGGGIADSDGGTLLNCTVAENVAHVGGGLFYGAGLTFSVKNTIVALNLVDVGGTGPDVNGFFTTGGHNLIGDGTGGDGFTNGTSGDIVGTDASPIDPRLGALRNNGGPTKTMALLAGSPAIDHGDNGLLPPTDQRGFGFPRRKDGNGDGLAVADIGAFER